MKRGAGTFAILTAAALVFSGCANEEKVIRYNPFLANVPGATTQVKPVGPRFEEYKDPSKVEGDKTIIENPDGSITLIAKSIRHLMGHIQLCLQYEDDEILFDQVISEQTKQEFQQKGQDPHEALEFLKANKQDIYMMFSRMPFGEQSSSVILHQPARKTRMLQVTGLATRDLRFTELWAVMEKGNWKLLWIR